MELPISEHWRPEVKVAKKAEVKKIKIMKPLWKLKTKVKQKLEVAGSSQRKNNITSRKKS